jgi:energy-coupling factor transporter ATP-binding protein EcfA2
MPSPGLTVVAGRNGCGKSSFAEALEVALTQGSYRWRTRVSTLQKTWQNIHAVDPSEVVVRLTEEGKGGTTVGVAWHAGSDFLDGTSWVQRPGEGRQPGLDGLGWTTSMEIFRPFLSYSELGALFGEQSKLHDALGNVLGLDRLDDALDRLTTRRKELVGPAKAADERRKALKVDLAEVSDERAVMALGPLTRRKPDLVAVRSVVTGQLGPSSDGLLSKLRAVQG